MKTTTFAAAIASVALALGAGCTPPTPTPTNWYFDNDLDGYGDPAIVESAVGQPNGYVAQRGDCNDSDAAINPGATEVFDNADTNCDGIVDNVAFWYADNDTDGYGDPSVSLQQPTQPAGYVADNTDCDDTDIAVNSESVEKAGDGIDNNCNGQVDELRIGNIGPAGGTVFYLDETGRGGLEAAPEDQGIGAVVEFGCLIEIPGADGTAIGTGAQNTVDILAAGCTPSTVENEMAFSLAVNYSLNGFNDWFLPSLEELNKLYSARHLTGNFEPYVDPYSPVVYLSSSEINENGVWGKSWYSSAVWPSGAEIYAGKYFQGYVRAVRSFHGAWYADTDSDGYGDPNDSLLQFTQPAGYVLDNTDCNDNDATAYPDATEEVNGIDNDCDGRIDEQYDIGDTGPAGGIVFWVDEIEDHGLEVSPVNLDVAGDFYHGFGCDGIDVPGADGTSIGTGAQNTADILAAGCADSSSAATLADSYGLNGYDDWFLPSKDALIALYDQKEIVGGDIYNFYWSSSEYDANSSWNHALWNNWPIAPHAKDMGSKVRAVRAF